MDLQLFSAQNGRDYQWDIFLQTDLGQLHQAIPFDDLADCLPEPSNRGRPGIMDYRGAIGLMILKSYFNLSDAKLVERLNTDWAMQYFCGIRLRPGRWIKDKDFVGRWRRILSQVIDYPAFQNQLAKNWSAYMKNTSAVLMDATCMESHVRFPTDVKILWEAASSLWQILDQVCKRLTLRKIRRKQKALKIAYLTYQKLRRKSYKKGRHLRMRLLRFLEKGLAKWNDLMFKHDLLLRQKTFDRVELIKQVYQQQKLHFDDPEAKIKQRIVSLAKPYLRPIVRGKENKRVEFGAKVHSIMVDGITFIEHLSFEAFNESTRLKSSISLVKDYFGSCRQVGADRIYANNGNRRFCSQKGIATSFVPKGPKPKKRRATDLIRKRLAALRASQMEGTFGNEKLHYGLAKVKAKKQQTEILWIHFAVWTASAVKISKRMAGEKRKGAATKAAVKAAVKAA